MVQVPIAEGTSLGEKLTARGISARLSGGVGIALRCPSIFRIAPERNYHDVDICVSSKALDDFSVMLEQEGYVPEQRFNALNAGRQLIYKKQRPPLHLDVFVDRLRMCHVLDFRNQLSCADVSLPATELLLSKLQIVELTDKDLLDIYALLIDSEPAKGDIGPDGVALDRMARLCAQDWGWFTTTQMSLGKVVAGASIRLDMADAEKVYTHAAAISDELNLTPKSMRWKTRSRIGERIKWYELPEATDV